MSLLAAAIKRYSLPSFTRPIARVQALVTWRRDKQDGANAKQQPVTTLRAMHIQSIPMCMSTLMEDGTIHVVTWLLSRGG